MQEKLRDFKAEVFRALAHPTRIAIIELLRDHGEMPVTALLEKLGLEQSNVSQHLSILRTKNLVQTRKEGNQVFYSLRDMRLGKVFDLMKQLFHAHLSESLALLQDLSISMPRKSDTTRKGH